MALALMAASSLFAQTPPAPTPTPTPPAGGGGGGGGGSSTAPNEVPLGSPEILKAYALTLVGQISVQVYGQSVSGDYYRFVDYPFIDADPERMAQVAGEIVLHFSATVDDGLTSYVSYNSRTIKLSGPGGETSSSFNLFYGSRQFKLEYFKDAWQVPKEAYQVELDLGQVPWIVSGMRNAYIESDQTGYYNFRQHQGDYWLDRGVIFLAKELTSRRGELTLHMQDGSKVIYDLGTGDRKATATVEAVGFRPTIKGIRSVPDNTTNIVYQDTDEIIRVATIGQSDVQVSFPSGLKRYPVKVYVIDTRYLVAFPDTEWREFNPYIEPVKFSFGDSAVLIRFEYPPEPQPPLNSGDRGPTDGKG